MTSTPTLKLARYTAQVIIPDLRKSLTHNKVDYTSILTSLAVNAAGGNEILYEGSSRGGHTGSLKRVGKRMKEESGSDEFLIDTITGNKYFGGVNVSVLNHRNINHTLYMEPEVKELTEHFYLESPYCREGEYDKLLDTARGLYMTNVLGDQLHGVTNYRTGITFDAKGTKYLRSLAETYENDPTQCFYRLMGDCEQAGLVL